MDNRLGIRVVEARDAGELLRRRRGSYGEAAETVARIVRAVREDGLAAVLEFTGAFDGVDLSPGAFRVDPGELREAWESVDEGFRRALTEAHGNITRYHERQTETGFRETDGQGNLTGLLVRPLERVGLYVPGGTAAYPSSVLMTAIPARAAGVPRIAMVSPPGPDGNLDPHTLAAAHLCGITEVYRAGGAQAVAALAYGAGDLEPVDLIAGPGNLYVTLAKKEVYGDVEIDMLAGPSEILVVADASARPAFVAADLLSQAEHDRESAALLVTDSRELAGAVVEELAVQTQVLARAAIARESLVRHGGVVVTESLAEAVELANRFAPEHLELAVEDPLELLEGVRHAGAVFLGHYTPESLGDYYAGPNHVLPTMGTARFCSLLHTGMFQKRMSILSYTRTGLAAAAGAVVCLAETEKLGAHARSVRIRLEEEVG